MTAGRRAAGRLAFCRSLRRAGALIRATRTADPAALEREGGEDEAGACRPAQSGGNDEHAAMTPRQRLRCLFALIRATAVAAATGLAGHAGTGNSADERGVRLSAGNAPRVSYSVNSISNGPDGNR